MTDAADLQQVAQCDLCRGERFADILVAGNWRLVRCEDCSLVMTSPRRSPSAMTAFYQTTYYEQAPAYAHAQLRVPAADDLQLARTLTRAAERSRLARPFVGLDVGCGHGRRVAALDAWGWHGIGLEPSNSAVGAARAAGRDVRQGLLESFDTEKDLTAVLALHVVEHTFSPRRFLEQCARILTPGGLLLLEVPDFDCPASRRAGSAWNGLKPDVHLYQFTRKTLDRYLSQSGFEPIRWWRLSGRGFLRSAQAQQHSGGQSASARCSLRERLFALRHLFYWLPGAKPLARWVTWELLGQAEAVRVLAKYRPKTNGDTLCHAACANGFWSRGDALSDDHLGCGRRL